MDERTKYTEEPVLCPPPKKKTTVCDTYCTGGQKKQERGGANADCTGHELLLIRSALKRYGTQIAKRPEVTGY